ncbi:MAG: class I SAM-dependent methyltransferase [Candidatus Binatia bacterium]
MAKISDPWDHHDWSSRDYVSQWADRQDPKEQLREEPFRLMAEALPYDPSARIALLDLGAGYGALSQFLLGHFPNAKAVCHDGSAEMLKLGRERMAQLKGRVKYVQCDLSKKGWSRKIKGPFDAVVSSIAIHNVRAHDTIHAIYGETFSLVKPGGCFLNFDRMTPSLQEQLNWLKDSGFEDVKCFWQSAKRALVGGFRKKSQR